MDTISVIVLILLSVFGYSLGAALKAGKSADVKPVAVDLVLLSAIIAAALWTRLAVDLDRWLALPIWLFSSMLMGALAVWSRRLPEQNKLVGAAPQAATGGPLKRLWRQWTELTVRAGGFQTRVFLTLFFLSLAPMAVAVRVFSDSLGIRFGHRESYWLPRKAGAVDPELLERQY